MDLETFRMIIGQFFCKMAIFFLLLSLEVITLMKYYKAGYNLQNYWPNEPSAVSNSKSCLWYGK